MGEVVAFPKPKSPLTGELSIVETLEALVKSIKSGEVAANALFVGLRTKGSTGLDVYPYCSVGLTPIERDGLLFRFIKEIK